jgi:hypothetical protein
LSTFGVVGVRVIVVEYRPGGRPDDCATTVSAFEPVVVFAACGNASSHGAVHAAVYSIFVPVLVNVTVCGADVAFGASAKCSAIGLVTSIAFELTYIRTGIVTVPL